MNQHAQTITEAVSYHVRTLFQAEPSDKRVYHNLRHTEAVVAAAGQIAEHYQLPPLELEIVLIAAWFHDVGYLTHPEDHEQASAEAAAAFLEGLGWDAKPIERVKGCIMATKIPQSPKNLLEEILCDADLFHLGKDRFKEIDRLMCEEKGQCLGRLFSKQEWRQGTIQFLEAHHYHTDYARMLLDDKKAANLSALKKKQAARQAKRAGQLSRPESLLRAGGEVEGSSTVGEEPGGQGGEKKQKKQKREKNKSAKERPDKGIETMFRVTAGNNQRLSNMADNKAHILISVNSIILSAVISLLLRKLDANEELILPTFILITVSLITIIFSILATRPTIPEGTFTQQDIDERKTNLLFFGNFYKMNLEQYTDGMWKVMEDRDFLYGSLIKDVYAQGVVLGKKYRLLRISYNVFMYGLILSVLAYMVGVLFS